MHTNYRRGETPAFIRRCYHKYSNRDHTATGVAKREVKTYSDSRLRTRLRTWLHNEQWEEIPDPLLREADDLWNHD